MVNSIRGFCIVATVASAAMLGCSPPPEVLGVSPPPPLTEQMPRAAEFEGVMAQLGQTARASIGLVKEAAARTGDDPAALLVALDDRLEVAKDAVAVMDLAAANVNRTLGFGAVAAQFGLAANPWADQGFRNFWDDVQGWGTGGALALGALAALTQGQPTEGEADDRIPLLAGSAALAGLAKLTGTIFGAQSGQKFESKVKFVEHTRQAYEDLRATYTMTETAFEQNKLFRERLAAIEALANTAATPEGKAEAVSRTVAELTTFDAMFLQIPSIYAAWEALLRKYCPPVQPNANTYECPEYFPREVVSHYETARVRIGILREIAEKADEPLKMTPAIRLGLLGLEVPE